MRDQDLAGRKETRSKGTFYSGQGGSGGILRGSRDGGGISEVKDKANKEIKDTIRLRKASTERSSVTSRCKGVCRTVLRFDISVQICLDSPAGRKTETPRDEYRTVLRAQDDG